VCLADQVLVERRREQILGLLEQLELCRERVGRDQPRTRSPGASVFEKLLR